MNLPLVYRSLGIVALLIGGAMLFSLPWALPELGHRHAAAAHPSGFESDGFWALVMSFGISITVGLCLLWRGRTADGRMFRKEAMAVVGLSWLMATLLGALPFGLSHTYRSPGVRLWGPGENCQLYSMEGLSWSRWTTQGPLGPESYRLIEYLRDVAGANGVAPDQFVELAERLKLSRDVLSLAQSLKSSDPNWDRLIVLPDEPGLPDWFPPHLRLRWIRVNWLDAMFESQSGFSTTGATVLSDLENPRLVQHCILFWRSSTHFLGGLGIIVLFVAILGGGAAGKAMMRLEMPGPNKQGSQSRMQDTALLFAAIYTAFNALLTIILKLEGLTWFDALCHSFGTMATGGFSTYNRSLAYFDSGWIEATILLFMILAGSNFTLLQAALFGRPQALLRDTEFRVYIGVLLLVTLLVVAFGQMHHDFAESEIISPASELFSAIRFGSFQVVSIMTTTGYGTHDFDAWNSFGRGVLFLLMFVGGCAGSTAGGMKVIRHILFLKILRLEVERSYHPTVVRPLRLAGKPLEDATLGVSILVYFGIILFLFVFSWIAIVTFEPNATWGPNPQHKLIDSATAIGATLNNIGPGLGTVGATQNYGYFTGASKLLFTLLMMIGRVEVFAIVVLLFPSYWRSR